MRDPSEGFEAARQALHGRQWTAEEADGLRALIAAGEARAIPYRERCDDPLREALHRIATDLLDVARYRNMKAFPAVVFMAKRAANQASEAIGYRSPFPNPHEIG